MFAVELNLNGRERNVVKLASTDAAPAVQNIQKLNTELPRFSVEFSFLDPWMNTK